VSAHESLARPSIDKETTAGSTVAYRIAYQRGTLGRTTQIIRRTHGDQRVFAHRLTHIIVGTALQNQPHPSPGAKAEGLPGIAIQVNVDRLVQALLAGKANDLAGKGCAHRAIRVSDRVAKGGWTKAAGIKGRTSVLENAPVQRADHHGNRPACV